MQGLQTIAGVVAGFKAGDITERTAKRLLLELGADNDEITSLLSFGAGIVGGMIVGDIVADAVGDIFGLFD